MIQKEFNIRSAVVHKIIHKKQYTKKFICRWSSPVFNRTEKSGAFQNQSRKPDEGMVKGTTLSLNHNCTVKKIC